MARTERPGGRRNRRRVRRALAIAALVGSAPLRAQLEIPPDVPRPGSTAPRDPASAPGTAVGASAFDTSRDPLAVNYGVRFDTIYSDNARLAPPGQEESEIRFEISPYVSVFANGPQAQGYLFYSPRFIVRTLDDTENELRHDLSAFGNYYLYEDKVGIRATANVFDTNLSPFGVTSVDPGVNPDNRTTYKAFSLSPYARGRLWNAADAEARYRFDYVDQGGNVESEITHRVSGAIGNVSGTSRLGWRALGTYATSEFESGFSYDRAFATALGYYVFDAFNRIGVGFNCAYNEILLDDQGNNSGCGPAVAGEWRPGPRTVIGGYFANAYYGYTGTARATHVADGWLFGLQYRQGVFDRSDASTSFIDPLAGFGGDGTVAVANRALLDMIETRQGSVLPAQRSSLSFGTIQSALVRERAVTANVAYARGRTGFGVSVFYSHQDTDSLNLNDNLVSTSSVTDLDQRGVDLSATYFLDARSSVIGGVRTTYSSSVSADTDSRLTSIFAGYRTQLAQRLFGGLTYRFSTQRADGPAATDYDENALIATLDFRF